MLTAHMASSHTFAAFLGHHPTVSLAEIRCFLPDTVLLRMINPQTALLRSAEPLNPKALRDWGGTVLVAEELPGVGSIQEIPAALLRATEHVKGKVTFSVRGVQISFETLHRLYRNCKNAYKTAGRPVRYIGNERKPPVTGQLHDAGILDGKHGCEIVILGGSGDEEFLWVGKTIAAQDPAAYTKRDMEKPVRDTRVGLLPPKLAQMLLNFGQWLVKDTRGKAAPSVLTIFDPFCGTGVIPMEALLRGWPVLGSDLSLKAVNGCEKNLEWIRKEEKIKKSDVPSSIWKQDACKPFDLEKGSGSVKQRPDVIVTETTLGPALTERPNAKDATKTRSECDATEIAFLENVAATLPGVPVVATFPVWYVKSGPLFLERTWKALAKIGFTPVLPPGAASDHPEHPSLLYRRPDQFVGREIVLLKPTTPS